MVWFILAHIFRILVAFISISRLSDLEKDLEILVLRQQLSILQRKTNKPVKPNQIEKMTLAILIAKLQQVARRPSNQLHNIIRIFKPETVLRWHRELVRRKWSFIHKSKGGRPRISQELEKLIIRLAQENPRWGYGKIQGELLKLGSKVSQTTIRNILERHNIQPALVRSGSIGWRSLINHYKDQILACDFFTVETIQLQTLYVFFFIELGSRQVYFAGITANPNETWVTQQARQLVWKLNDRENSFYFLIRDNDRKFSKTFDSVFESEGFRIIHTPFHAPNANAYSERWVRSVREECLDQILILNTAHLHRVLHEYINNYYNVSRPHQGIEQRTPIPPAQPNSTGAVQRRKVLGGIINDYYRAPNRSVLSTT